MTITSTYAICEDCKEPMRPRGGCTYTHVSKKDLVPVKRIFLGEESEDWGNLCHDCNAGPGQPHHAGCDAERCPGCGVQMLNCLGEPDPEFAEFGPSCGWIHLLKF